MNKFLEIMRPAHWSKNMFVFVALIFGRKFIGPASEVSLAVKSAIAAFFCFCMASSAIYIFNDILDRKNDTLHPQKSKRPIAAGTVGLFPAGLLAVICAIVALVSSYILVKQLAIIIAAYIILMILYSLLLKKMMILDVITISIGFVLRAIAGAIAVGVFISQWLIICTFALCLFLGFGKRRSEIAMLTNNSALFRKTLAGYNIELLNHMLDVTSGLAIVCFLLYSMDDRTFTILKTNDLVYTTPFVLYCIFRFSALIQKGTYSGPVQIITRDILFQISFVLWALSCTAIVYAAHLNISITDIIAY